MKNNMFKDIKSAHDALVKKEIGVSELIQEFLKIAQTNSNNAYITVLDEENIKEQCKIAQEKIDKNEGTYLTGIPYGVKDSICTKDVLSTAATKILGNYTAPYDATVIKKIKEEGAILIGKQNCDAFGHGASNENSMYGPVKNPHDKERVSGGSSGGSAAAVAENSCLFSVAEDTGGSIRQPSSFCGISGLRPTYGRNSRYGVMPMASSLDTVGPMANNVRDLAHIMEVMAGQDFFDATSVPLKPQKYSEEIEKDLKGLRVGIPKEYFEGEGLNEEVKNVVLQKIDELKKLGVEIKEIGMPFSKYAVPVYYIIVPAEDSSNLGRIDAIRYGEQIGGETLDETYKNSRTAGLPLEVKRRIMMGTYVLSSGYIDAYYKKAAKVRTLIIQDFDNSFRKVDAILSPTAPTTAFKIGEKQNDLLAMYKADIFVSPSALAGLPSLSINIGKDSNNLPVGLQIMTNRLRDDLALRIGHQIQTNLL
jgi:aspartyl-tRNA(Asn)/glutamyl-tRNA(Gln) amidotransferase subunit A